VRQHGQPTVIRLDGNHVNQLARVTAHRDGGGAGGGASV
jgi:hypothetical protein